MPLCSVATAFEQTSQQTGDCLWSNTAKVNHFQTTHLTVPFLGASSYLIHTVSCVGAVESKRKKKKAGEYEHKEPKRSAKQGKEKSFSFFIFFGVVIQHTGITPENGPPLLNVCFVLFINPWDTLKCISSLQKVKSHILEYFQKCLCLMFRKKLSFWAQYQPHSPEKPRKNVIF